MPGALDHFVLRLFILEAGMQGLAGSAAGSLAGAALALAGGVIRYGTTAVSQAAAGDVAASIGLSTAIGIGLSLLGVSYPALVAARMQPVEAMRWSNKWVYGYPGLQLLFSGRHLII